ncbi:sigma 54-interacting transcriptional regulator [bacterium]|nr:sigma 54-interacting transcriptional regulator [bacterium]
MAVTLPPTMDAIGQSEVFLEFQERLSRVARVNRPVLLLGERGTGKELAAHRLHYLSGRWQGPFVALNCAALAPGLIESELFGHEKGAFTGAVERRRGRFELAHGGTLFLDELGCVPLEAQEKILRVVEYGSFERVGGQRPVQVDARLIGASNRNLLELAQCGRFKEDLLDRLSFEVLFVPPLRARREDIPLLAMHFAARMAQELGRRGVPEFSDAALETLCDYAWPGNVRELRNVVERAVYRAEDLVIEEIDLSPFRSPYEAPPPDAPAPPAAQLGLKEAVRRLEQSMLEEALAAARGSQQEAARRLGLTYHQFRGLYRKYKRRKP